MLHAIMASSSPKAISSSTPFDFSVVREIRKREGLTLEEVSRRSGISIAVLSRLERNQTVAELETLHRLARTFGMNATDLLLLAENPFGHRKLAEHYRSGDFTFEVVRYPQVSCFIGSGRAGATIRKPEIHHDDYETCWVLEGRVRIHLGGESVEIASGESFQFDAIQEHAYEAVADSRLVIVHSKKPSRH